MKTYTQKDLDSYMRNDWIREMMDKNALPWESSVRTNEWLYSMDNKRCIYADVYGDILQGRGGKILDTGGGV